MCHGRTLGSEGVESALVLAAQRDERLVADYHGQAVASARRKKGQNTVDVLLAEKFE
jgi:hypothetical protein